MSPCPEPVVLARWVDGELTLNDAAALARHAGQCAACRARQAHLMALRASLPSAHEDAAFVGDVMARLDRWDPNHWDPKHLVRWLSLAAVVAVVIAVVATRPHGELVARGGGGGLEVAATVEAATRQALADEVIRVAPGFAITARVIDRTTTPSWLMVFGVDARCEVHWLVPAWDDATSDPVGRRFAGEAPLVELPEGLRPDAPPGPFTLVVATSDAPRSVHAVEALLGPSADDRCGLGRLAALGIHTTTHPLEVSR